MDYVEFRAGKGFWRFDLNVRGTYPLARALDFWMAELARDHLRLGLCFRALAIMLQVPGAAGYEWLGDDSLIDNLGCRNRSLGGGRWCDRRCRRWRLGSGGSRR